MEVDDRIDLKDFNNSFNKLFQNQSMGTFFVESQLNMFETRVFIDEQTIPNNSILAIADIVNYTFLAVYCI